MHEFIAQIRRIQRVDLGSDRPDQDNACGHCDCADTKNQAESESRDEVGSFHLTASGLGCRRYSPFSRRLDNDPLFPDVCAKT
ncbi:MAG: hypothetical protein KGK16_12420, partial [Bradyrhizobium sp.]|nr:hypothetical protein [Bradyrhizobium sp.]